MSDIYVHFGAEGAYRRQTDVGMWAGSGKRVASDNE